MPDLDAYFKQVFQNQGLIYQKLNRIEQILIATHSKPNSGMGENLPDTLPNMGDEKPEEEK